VAPVPPISLTAAGLEIYISNLVMRDCSALGFGLAPVEPMEGQVRKEKAGGAREREEGHVRGDSSIKVINEAGGSKGQMKKGEWAGKYPSYGCISKLGVV
jgi:hypothetical protein